MLQIVNVKQCPLGKEKAIDYIHQVWRNNDSMSHFYDVITKLSLEEEELVNFYVLVQDQTIIGCCGLLTHDVVTSRGLYPWVTSLFVEETYRGKNYGQLLMNHVGHIAQLMGYQRLYLTTGKTDYYRRFGWEELETDSSQIGTNVYYKVLLNQK